MVVNGKFFISSGDAAAFFQVSEHAFDGVAFFIGLTIKGSRGSLFVRFVSDHRRDSAFAQAVAIVLRRAAFVAGHLLRSLANTSRWRADRHLIHRRQNQRIVACLTSSHQRCQWQRMIITHRYELGRETAFRLADSVVFRLAFDFFFKAPADDLWALTIVPSTENSDQSILPSALKRISSFSRIVSQVPSCCQSRYRAYNDPHLPYCFGMSRQGAPVLRHHKMPLIVRRRSCILHPRPAFNSGRQGSKTSHCTSVSSWRPIKIPSFLKLNAIVSLISKYL